MKFNLSKIHLKIKKNFGIFFLILISMISIFSMQIYNFNKDIKERNYINLINNTYFQKSLNYIIYNLEPKYIEIEHKVKNGETSNDDRKHFAAKAFNVSSHYDTAIFNYFNSGEEPALKVSETNAQVLRYGENPHQKGYFFGDLEMIFDKSPLSTFNFLRSDWIALPLESHTQQCQY